METDTHKQNTHRKIYTVFLIPSMAKIASIKTNLLAPMTKHKLNSKKHTSKHCLVAPEN